MQGGGCGPTAYTHQHLLYPDQAKYGWADDIPVLAGGAFMVAGY